MFLLTTPLALLHNLLVDLSNWLGEVSRDVDWLINYLEK
jgi:hypothetical protein